MSDVSQGPGWWLASDGRWYPPESHPSFQPPPPTPPQSPPSFAAPPGPYPVGSTAYPTTSGPYSVSPTLADYGQRLAGWLIDWVLLLVVSVPISILTHSYHYSHVSGTVNFRVGTPGALLSPLIVIAYGTLLCGSTRGQTLGMMIMGTKAVKLSTGGPIGYGPALGRAAFEMFLAIALFVPWVIDMLFPIWDRQNQTLHDKVSGTVVVRVNRY